MKLIDDWRAELNRLWSIRVAIGAALIGSADQIVYVFFGAGFIPPWAYAALSLLFILLRLKKQPNAAPAAAT